MFKAAACLFAAAGACAAGPVTLDWVGTGQGRNMSITVEGGFSGTAFAGSLEHRVDGAPMLLYCIDPFQEAQNGVANFDRTSLPAAFSGLAWGDEKAAAVGELADRAGDSIWTTGADRDTAAAFQLALWEIIVDLDPDRGGTALALEGGGFRASGRKQVLSLAGSLLSELTFSDETPRGYDAFVHPQHQDFFGPSIPAPGALALAAVGLPGLVSGGRRRRS